jgi:hypothetical protein
MELLRWSQKVWPRFAPMGAKVCPWLGGVLLALSAGFAAHSWLHLRSGLRAQATVTESVALQAPDGTVTYASHLRFRLPTGEIVTFVDPVLSTSADDPRFVPGTVVPVLYPANKPTAAIIVTVWRVYFVAIVLGILGVVFLDLGIVLRRLRSV